MEASAERHLKRVRLDRNAVILRAAAAGMSQSEIARIVGKTRQFVAKVIERGVHHE